MVCLYWILTYKGPSNIMTPLGKFYSIVLYMHKALLSRGYTFSRSWMVENSNGGMCKILSNFGHFGKFLPKLEISNWNNVYHGFNGWGLIFTLSFKMKKKKKMFLNQSWQHSPPSRVKFMSVGRSPQTWHGSLLLQSRPPRKPMATLWSLYSYSSPYWP